jgi:hypothetical protein
LFHSNTFGEEDLLLNSEKNLVLHSENDLVLHTVKKYLVLHCDKVGYGDFLTGPSGFEMDKMISELVY